MSALKNAQYDDKCGSDYLHLPVYKYLRETQDWLGKWRYRVGLQGNLFPGDLLRFSIVPPHLKTGSSFGCTAFLSGLERMHDLGLLGEEIVRQTDGGSDNVSAETHAFHFTLISKGVLQRLLWIRLRAKHSHNFADRANSMIKHQGADQA